MIYVIAIRNLMFVKVKGKKFVTTMALVAFSRYILTEYG